MCAQIDLLQYRLSDLDYSSARAALFDDLVATGRGISPQALPAFLGAIRALVDRLEADLESADRVQLDALRALEAANDSSADLSAVIDNAVNILET